MVLPWITLKGRQLPGHRNWDRIGITWEAYLRWETRGFRARHEPQVQSSSCRERNKATISISTQPNKWVTTRTCIIGKPTERYRYHIQRNLTRTTFYLLIGQIQDRTSQPYRWSEQYSYTDSRYIDTHVTAVHWHYCYCYRLTWLQKQTFRNCHSLVARLYYMHNSLFSS